MRSHVSVLSMTKVPNPSHYYPLVVSSLLVVERGLRRFLDLLDLPLLQHNIQHGSVGCDTSL